MFSPWIFTVFTCLFAIAAAVTPPAYSGYTTVWQQGFDGQANTFPSTSTWNIIERVKNYNNEVQAYVKSTSVLRQTGKNTLQLIPRFSSKTKKWTSARIESTYTLTPKLGKITRVEASLRLGGNSARSKQGIWPAFWLLGDAIRNGVEWPACGEVDIMENVNGQKIGYGAVHCDKAPGGICNEPNGIASNVQLPDSKYHVWRVQFDRRSSNLRSQSITWYLDGRVFHRVTGAQVNNTKVWKSLCHSPMFVIFNVAVGGDWPGVPNSSTKDGIGNHMEVEYVAHYVSN
ncbi:endo-1 3(4)-beta-glucanase [Fusarium pseudoanthophilum]|uniref:Endo-1 3(4)-beta-glucanase n=1 Tax=Fusarium pseudoanthophilum TaxID=48495 RepID=A0A8H5P6E5_9HYPO|nr:endo-1 3(4)-beta-glucanase [Fusarium pseudoanthophilum]